MDNDSGRLREKVAKVAFETEVGYAPDDRAWERANAYWLGFADKILAIPEIAQALADTPNVSGLSHTGVDRG